MCLETEVYYILLKMDWRSTQLIWLPNSVQGVLVSYFTVSSVKIFVVIYQQGSAHLCEDKRLLKYSVYCT
jgi:hypothetical protein